ncbi:ImmA/IrrE family metallo-endopeptidase [Tistrella bauzanensis]|uniref:ImmA/IrrE family metallo-endopeptidase n=1 Tax=Tistrella arctica TaxID=3133430 RepID=A0ABU9YH84_9PROT
MIEHALRADEADAGAPHAVVPGAVSRHQQSAPVKIVAIARDLGLRVWTEPLPDALSGKLVRDPERAGASGWAIIVNAQHVKARRRFTIAHEIAHFLLHRDQALQGVQDDAFYRSHLSGAIETEANRFAAQLLMPWPLIRSLNAEGVTEIRDLAARLEVSETAMRIRLGLPT